MLLTKNKLEIDVFLIFGHLVLSIQEIQRLNLQLREKQLELESVKCQPGHEKDQEIHRLRSVLEEKERAEATRTVLCTSLAEEAEQLRAQLGATVKVCQELLARLEKETKEDRRGGGVEEMFQQRQTKEVGNVHLRLFLLLKDIIRH